MAKLIWAAFRVHAGEKVALLLPASDLSAAVARLDSIEHGGADSLGTTEGAERYSLGRVAASRSTILEASATSADVASGAVSSASLKPRTASDRALDAYRRLEK